ncbi:hypothetical protein SAMN04488595_11840 [Ralstonia sp. 25mfcol4.1]|uniref:hypothetical protein n=1 Tax=Ralstonia sp. 25mfcol4.1 TaxID=1761899 RepID=UPI00048CF054|nr:hypothetical protein [Ralstonia sp. 25mfcol4.1]SDP72286.1 hypothetical protein SAMN04488595_11840 [Ralstonia sp. 25mfcol4.1]
MWPFLNHQVLDDAGPAITRPVTSQKRVRIAREGPRIVLGFECGFVEAMLLIRCSIPIVPMDGQRLPNGMCYAGSGSLNLEAYLVQDDPMAALDSLLRLIRDAGGVPQLAPGFLEHPVSLRDRANCVPKSARVGWFLFMECTLYTPVP